MVTLTRLDGSLAVVNSSHILVVESTPDTVLTLTTGDRMMVRESVTEVVDRVVAYQQRVAAGPDVRDFHGAGQGS